MIFKQFYLESLGHASYLIGSEQSRQALVLDVRRDVDVYFQEAREQGLQIRYAVDTHQHNDYLTGICELPARGPVKLLGSARAQLGYPAKPLQDGETFTLGEIVFHVLQTPGHTPEHISLLVSDLSRGGEPVLLLSGGSLLVGDVARPDLLGGKEETRKAAQTLCRTLRDKILPLPDHVMVFPTHVSGSLCGGHIGSMLYTTIGYEKRMNRLLSALDENSSSLEELFGLQNLPTVPPYWRRMRRQNQEGPALLGVLREPPPLIPEDMERLVKDGALILDCRSPEAFGGGHIPGALNVGVGSSFATWAGTVLPEGARIVLVLEQENALWDVCWQLLRIGYDLPLGWLAGGMYTWRTSARPIKTLPQWTVWELEEATRRDHDLNILDVRQPAEWNEGHIPGALHISGGSLVERLDEVPRDRPVAVICGSGYRSSVAASLLLQRGHRSVFNVLGGMSAWKRAGLPLQ